MITAAFVRDCKPRAKMYEVTCDALPGFILRVLPTGKKVALVRYRVDGKDHRAKLGMLGPGLSIDEARRQAAVVLASAAVGLSEPERPSPLPAVTPARLVQPEPPAPQVISLRSLAERFVRTHVDVHLKPGTAERYRQQLAVEILPKLGDRDFRSIKRADVQELHAGMKDRPGAANNMVVVISSLYARIIDDWELCDMRNPARGVRMFPMNPRERFLTPEERQRINAVIQAGLNTPAGRSGHIALARVWALDLLALTGRRRNEILTLQWSMVDWQHSLLNLPDTKTGQLRVPVSAHVLALLKVIHEQTGRPTSGYVLRTPKGTRLRSINRTWEGIRAAAGIPDVRLHDLRHSFASDALMSGVPLAVVGEFLGHKESRTTQRYAHLANHVVRQALEVATDRIVAASKPIAALPSPRFEPLSDEQWQAIAAMVEATRGRCGGQRTNLRRTVDAIRWVFHTGGKWRDIPAEFGAGSTSWRWYERWSGDGTWQAITANLEPPPDGLGQSSPHATLLAAGDPRAMPRLMAVANGRVR
jgi:integrase